MKASDTGKTFDDYREIIRKLKQKLQSVLAETESYKTQLQALETAKKNLLS